jgi:hypothetical protein
VFEAVAYDLRVTLRLVDERGLQFVARMEDVIEVYHRPLDPDGR